MRYTKLWGSLTTVIITSFAVLGYFGNAISRQAPPVPARVVRAWPQDRVVADWRARAAAAIPTCPPA